VSDQKDNENQSDDTETPEQKQTDVTSKPIEVEPVATPK